MAVRRRLSRKTREDEVAPPAPLPSLTSDLRTLVANGELTKAQAHTMMSAAPPEKAKRQASEGSAQTPSPVKRLRGPPSSPETPPKQIAPCNCFPVEFGFAPAACSAAAVPAASGAVIFSAKSLPTSLQVEQAGELPSRPASDFPVEFGFSSNAAVAQENATSRLSDSGIHVEFGLAASNMPATSQTVGETTTPKPGTTQMFGQVVAPTANEIQQTAAKQPAGDLLVEFASVPITTPASPIRLGVVFTSTPAQSSGQAPPSGPSSSHAVTLCGPGSPAQSPEQPHVPLHFTLGKTLVDAETHIPKPAPNVTMQPIFDPSFAKEVLQPRMADKEPRGSIAGQPVFDPAFAKDVVLRPRVAAAKQASRQQTPKMAHKRCPKPTMAIETLLSATPQPTAIETLLPERPSLIETLLPAERASKSDTAMKSVTWLPDRPSLIETLLPAKKATKGDTASKGMRGRTLKM